MIQKFIYKILNDDLSLRTLLNGAGKIHPLAIPDEIDAPVIVYKNSINYNDSKTGNYQDLNNLDLIIYDSSYSNILSIYNKIKDVFNTNKRFEDSTIKISEIKIENVNENYDFEANIYVLNVSVLIKYNEK